MKHLLMTLGIVLGFNSAQAQFNAVIYTFDTFTNACDGSGEMLQDGQQAVSVYWDANNNGPDAADVIAPDAVQAVYALNGYDYLGIPGAWYSDPAFTYNNYTPTVSRFYVVIEGWDARWTSSVFTIGNGYSERDLTGSWTCTEVPCDNPESYTIDWDGWSGPNFECIFVCSSETISLCFAPRAEDERPQVLLFPGCLGNGCDVDCPPANFGYDHSSWSYVSSTGTWCNTISILQGGCICVMEDFLPVEAESFSATPLDRSARILWSTASETEVDAFKLFRNGQLTYIVPGSNLPIGSQYAYLDEGLQNGQAYEYSLEVSNLDGTVEAWPWTASATPRVDNAVVTEYALLQNYPNPFNPSTNLVFDVVAENVVNLTVYNAMGQEVATLVNGTMAAGRHTVTFDATNLTSGLYFYTVKIGNEFTATKKMLLVK